MDYPDPIPVVLRLFWGLPSCPRSALHLGDLAALALTSSARVRGQDKTAAPKSEWEQGTITQAVLIQPVFGNAVELQEEVEPTRVDTAATVLDQDDEAFVAASDGIDL